MHKPTTEMQLVKKRNLKLNINPKGYLDWVVWAIILGTWAVFVTGVSTYVCVIIPQIYFLILRVIS